MMRAALVAFLALAAACTQTATTPPPSQSGSSSEQQTGMIGEDTCGMAAHRNLIGMDESAIDRSSLQQPYRIICFGCMMTMDYSPHRLTIQIGPGHKVASLRCG